MYEMEVERLNKVIDEKNNNLKNKEIYIKKTEYGNITALEMEKNELTDGYIKM
jgi:hypothetical protein